MESPNSVQPYCRFAIIAMQTMPIASCSQRKYLPSANGTDVVCGVTVMIPPLVRFCFGIERYRGPILVCDMPERKNYSGERPGRGQARFDTQKIKNPGKPGSLF